MHDTRDPTNWYIKDKPKTASLPTFQDKFIQVDFTLASQHVWGLGARYGQNQQVPDGAYSLWSKDSNEAPTVDNGQGGVSALDVHPFFIVQSHKKTDDFAGVYFHSSSALAPILQKDAAPLTTSTLSFVATGGIVEVFIFGHGSHNDVVKMYHNIVGKPALPPYWALGFH